MAGVMLVELDPAPPQVLEMLEGLAPVTKGRGAMSLRETGSRCSHVVVVARDLRSPRSAALPLALSEGPLDVPVTLVTEFNSANLPRAAAWRVSNLIDLDDPVGLLRAAVLEGARADALADIDRLIQDADGLTSSLRKALRLTVRMCPPPATVTALADLVGRTPGALHHGWERRIRRTDHSLSDFLGCIRMTRGVGVVGAGAGSADGVLGRGCVALAEEMLGA